MSAVRSTAPVALITVTACGILAFCIFLVLLAVAPNPQSVNTADTPRPFSAIGYGGLAQLLHDEGIAVTAAPIDAAQLRQFAGLVIVAPMAPTDDTLSVLPVSGSHVLLVPPKWVFLDDDTHPGWVNLPGFLPDAQLARAVALPRPVGWAHRADDATPLLRVAPPFASGEAPTPLPVRGLRSFTGAGWTPMLQTQNGETVLAQFGRFYLLSDPDLLNNRGLRERAGAEAALALVDRLREGGPVWLATEITTATAKQRNPLALAFRPPFLAATISLVVAALLLGWQALWRFGPTQPPLRAFASGKSTLADNTAALIERAGRAARMGPGYLALCRDAVMARTRSGPADTDATLQQLQRLRHPQADIATLERQIAAVQTKADLLAAAAQLHAWKQEMLSGGS